MGRLQVGGLHHRDPERDDSVIAAHARRLGGRAISWAKLARLRHLALWGRREIHEGQPVNLIVITGIELFAKHDIADAWKEIDGPALVPPQAKLNCSGS